MCVQARSDSAHPVGPLLILMLSSFTPNIRQALSQGGLRFVLIDGVREIICISGEEKPEEDGDVEYNTYKT
jgi:hypothetical protein